MNKVYNYIAHINLEIYTHEKEKPFCIFRGFSTTLKPCKTRVNHVFFSPARAILTHCPEFFVTPATALKL